MGALKLAQLTECFPGEALASILYTTHTGLGGLYL